MDQTIAQERESLKNRVLHMQSADFDTLALDVFRFQYAHNPLYQQYVQLSGILPEKVAHWTEIPFLPIELFKSHQVLTGTQPVLFSFESSNVKYSDPSKSKPFNEPIASMIKTLPEIVLNNTLS